MRALALCLALVSMLLLLPELATSNHNLALRLAAAAALTGLAAYWIIGYRRAHFALVGEPLEVFAIFFAGNLVDPNALLLPLFALLFRSLYGGIPLALARTAAYAVGLESVALIGAGLERDALIERQVGQALTAFILQALAGALQRQEAGEEALRLYQGVTDHALLTLDAGGRVSTWHVGAERVLGYERSEAIGRSVADLLEPERTNAESIRDLDEAATAGSAQSSGPRTCKGGRVIFADVVTTALRDEQGRLSGYLQLVRDVTARHRAAEALRESRERLRAVVQSSPITLWALDADGVCTLYEGGLSPVARGNMVGRRVEELAEAFPELLEMANLALSGSPAACRMDFGKTVADVRCQPMRDNDGKVNGVIGVATDITDRTRAEAEREQLQQQLVQAQRLESVGRLAGGVAHDFNNLLSVILSYAEFVGDQLPEGDTLVEDVDEIRKAAERAAGLTQQLLLFSRRQVANTEQLDLNDTLDDMEKLLQRALGSKLELVTQFERPLWTVEADPTRVEQVLMNLAVNARDAMPHGGVLTIETANLVLGLSDVPSADLDPGPYVRLTVRDTGEGMPADVIDHAFEPFYTTKSDGRGTGLGLATVYGIVTQAGGHIKLESESGQGTTVQVLLPAAEVGTGANAEPESAPVAALEPAPAGAPEPVAAGSRILIVEDQPAVAELARRMLERGGYRPLVAPDAASALELVESGEQIDLVLSDVVMPDMTGPELTARIAELRPGLGILFMSGHVDGVVDLDGSAPLVQKPFTSAVLLERVAASLVTAPQRASDVA
jgi:PAS domain S-box-containing protein